MSFAKCSLSFLKSLTVLLTLVAVTCNVQAASILSLSGKAADAKYEADSKVRVSVIDWSSEEQLSVVQDAFKQYKKDDDLDAFLAILEAQDTRGYLFTAAATGYRIKYAWQEDAARGKVMHFLITPGLKTRNPYLWNTPNNESPAFSLVQIALKDEEGVAKTSMEGEIVFNAGGKLHLDAFENLAVFSTMEDSTPYYLK